jgi:hypothetical protein
MSRNTRLACLIACALATVAGALAVNQARRRPPDFLGSARAVSAVGFKVSGFPSPSNAGTSQTFTVTAVDAGGNTVTNYTGTVAFASSSQSATLPAAYIFTGSEGGTKSFTAALNIDGTQSITAVDVTRSNVVGIQSGITIARTNTTIRYVSNAGNDSWDGTQPSFISGTTGPWLTITHALATIPAGAVLYLRAGTYAESISDNVTGGTSWYNCTLIAGYPGDATPILLPSSGSRVVFFSTATSAYTEFRNLIFDGSNITINCIKVTQTGSPATDTSSHIRVRNCEVRFAPSQGILLNDDTANVLNADYCEIINCNIHDNGLTNSQAHGIYAESSHHLFDGNTCYHNGGFGIQSYHAGDSGATKTHDNLIRNNVCHHNAQNPGANAGGIISSGSNNTLYNNVCYNNEFGIGIGVAGDSASSGALVYNNTCWNNGNVNDGTGITNRSNATNSTIVNNVCYQNDATTSNPRINNYVDHGTGTTQSNNLNWTASNTDPLFVNPAANDLRLQPTSPAIDAGTVASLVPVDILGVTRPQGAAYDLGAYEYQPPAPSPPAVIGERPGALAVPGR